MLAAHQLDDLSLERVHMNLNIISVYGYQQYRSCHTPLHVYQNTNIYMHMHISFSLTLDLNFPVFFFFFFPAIRPADSDSLQM